MQVSYLIHIHSLINNTQLSADICSLIEGDAAGGDELVWDGPAPHAVALEVDLPAQLPLDVAQDVRHLLLFDVAAAEGTNQGRSA